MAGKRRIRHKLLLGMALVVTIMAALIGGSLHGLGSYRSVMETYESKLAELSCAGMLKSAVAELKQPTGDRSQQTDINIILGRIKDVRKALDEYEHKLADTVQQGRIPGDEQQIRVDALRKDLTQLKNAVELTYKPSASFVDILAIDSPARAKMEKMEIDVGDLNDSITVLLSNSFEATRKEAHRSIIWVICTGALSVLVLLSFWRFVYVAVGQPIHDLELGVRRVAQGDFKYRIDIHSGDEIEALAQAFNQMADKLGTLYDNLAQQVNERSRQLVRSERLAGVGFLAAGVAHEINNPLAAILFSSEALESRLSELLLRVSLSSQDRETIAKYLKMIQEEAFRCKEITQKLLAFSRGGERKRELTDLVDVIQGVLDMVRHLQSCKGKQVDFQPIAPLCAWVNAQEIKQVFLNLVVNALESMDEGGTVTITPHVDAGQIVVTFKDTGCGMAPDVLENIFEPFFTKSRTGKGTGLGLSISHRIITQHGGEIEATSDGPGKGSTFVVRLPIEPANTAEPGQDVQDPVEEFLKLSAQKTPPLAA